MWTLLPCPGESPLVLLSTMGPAPQETFRGAMISHILSCNPSWSLERLPCFSDPDRLRCALTTHAVGTGQVALHAWLQTTDLSLARTRSSRHNHKLLSGFLFSTLKTMIALVDLHSSSHERPLVRDCLYKSHSGIGLLTFMSAVAAMRNSHDEEFSG